MLRWCDRLEVAGEGDSTRLCCNAELELKKLTAAGETSLQRVFERIRGDANGGVIEPSSLMTASATTAGGSYPANASLGAKRCAHLAGSPEWHRIQGPSIATLFIGLVFQPWKRSQVVS
jgi:hypothetical protein